MQRFEYIIVLSILFIITENIFVMPFSPLDVKKPLIKRFLCRFKGRWGVVDVGTGAENDYHCRLVFQTDGETIGM